MAQHTCTELENAQKPEKIRKKYFANLDNKGIKSTIGRA